MNTIHEQPQIKANIVHQNLLHKQGTNLSEKASGLEAYLSMTISSTIVIGLLFICVGMAVYSTSSCVSELIVEYTDCQPDSTELRTSYKRLQNVFSVHQVAHWASLLLYCQVQANML